MKILLFLLFLSQNALSTFHTCPSCITLALIVIIFFKSLEFSSRLLFMFLNFCHKILETCFSEFFVNSFFTNFAPNLNIFTWNFCAIVFLQIKKVKLVTVVEGDPRAPFSIATTPRRRGVLTPFHGFLHFTFDTYLITLNVKQGSIKYHLFFVFDIIQPWIKLRSPGPWTKSFYLDSCQTQPSKFFMCVERLLKVLKPVLVYKWLLQSGMHSTSFFKFILSFYFSGLNCLFASWLDR